MPVPLSRELETLLRDAREFAKNSKRPVSSAHLLLALFTVPNQAQNYLRDYDIDEDALLLKLRRLEPEPDGLLDVILERAAVMADGTHASTVTSLHLLSALSGFKDSAAYRLISSTGVDMGSIRTTVVGFLLNDDIPVRYRMRPGERVNAEPVQVSRPPTTIGVHPGLSPSVSRRRRTVTVIEPPAPKPAPIAEAQTSEPTSLITDTPKPSRSLQDRLEQARAENQKADQQPQPKDSATTRAKRTTRDEPARPSNEKRLAQRLFGDDAPDQKTRPPRAKVQTPRRRKTKSMRPQGIQPAGTRRGSLGADRFSLSEKDFPTLTKYGRNLTLAAAEKRIDPVIGRDLEIDQIIDVLNKRRSNNPVLVGDPGVGKTAVVEGLSLRIVAGTAPGLDGRILIELEAGQIFGGTGLRGSLAERLETLKAEVASAEGKVVVFLDEVHRWIGSGSGDSAGDSAEALKPALARGTFPCIGATTFEEYKRSFENDAAFSRRFQIVRVEEPDIEATTAILRGVISDYGEHHKLVFCDSAVETAARLSARYLPDRRNPDKSLAVLDLAGSKARRLGQKEVDEQTVARVIGEMAGVSPEKLLLRDRERFVHMEDFLMKSIVGHEGNLSRVAHVLRRNYAGFVSGRPIGSFLFLGPTGVGKTETAKALAEFLFHDRDAITAIDMSEYSESHSVARLIGAPPGYVGHEQGGALTDEVRRRPYQIVLFDEIEKAHPSVRHLLLQLLEEGRLTDSRGRTADFTNAVIIMTSNVGAEAAVSTKRNVGFGAGDNSGSTDERVREAARGHFEPEFWNRIDEPLVFEMLTEEQIVRIAHLKLQQSSRQLLEERGIAYTASPSVIDYLIENGGFEPELGARPLRRALERFVEGPIADLILRGAVESPGQVRVDVDGDALVFDVV